jgi:hypothetical protein
MAFDNFKKIVTEVLQISMNGKVVYPDASIQTTAYRGYAGQFSDYTNQTTSDATISKVITFNTSDYSDGISVISSSRITYANAGIYSLEFDIEVENSGGTRSEFYVWLSKNGTTVANSTSVASVPAIQTSVNGRSYVTATHLITISAGDYIELNWGTSSTSVQLSTFATGTSPTRPAAASVSVFTSLVK